MFQIYLELQPPLVHPLSTAHFDNSSSSENSASSSVFSESFEGKKQETASKNTKKETSKFPFEDTVSQAAENQSLISSAPTSPLEFDNFDDQRRTLIKSSSKPKVSFKNMW